MAYVYFYATVLRYLRSLVAQYKSQENVSNISFVTEVS